MGLRGSPKLEKNLSAIGRIKPFFATDYTSFLVWAHKYKKDIEVYTTSKKLNKKMFRLMIYYEKIPKEKIKNYRVEAQNRHQEINKKFASKIRLLKRPIQRLDDLLKNGYKVAVLISDYYLKRPRKPVPHWIVAFKKEIDKYYFIDSANGIISLTKQQLEEGFKINKKDGFNPQLIAYGKLGA